MEAMPLTTLVQPLSEASLMESRSRAELAAESSPILRRMEIQTADPTIRIIWLVADESTNGLVDLDINE